MSFDASKGNNWVTIPDSSALHLTNGMTLEAWVDPNALGTTWRTVLFKEQPGRAAYALYANQDKRVPVAQIYRGGTRSVSGTTQLPLNVWTHLAATYDGASLRLYVNGTLVRTTNVSGSMGSSTGALRLGGNSIGAEWFGGMIDEVRVYNRALAAIEIQADMRTPLGPDTTPPNPPTGLAQTGATGTSVSFAWAAAVDNGGVAGYDLYVNGAAAGSIAATNAVVGGLACGSTITFDVVAFDAAGNRSTRRRQAGRRARATVSRRLSR